jgi:hypothetical protein
MSRSLALAASCALFAACSTARYVGPVVTPAAVAQIRVDNPGEELTVDLEAVPSRSPERAVLHETTIATTSLTLPGEAAARVVPNDAVRQIITVHRSEGPTIGAYVGLAIGILAGVSAYKSYRDPCANNGSFGCVSFGPGFTSVTAGLLVGIPAIVFGTMIGARAERVAYQFGPPPSP